MSFLEAQSLPLMTSSAEEGALFRPSLEMKEVTPSYLTFLRRQIELGLRGEEWSRILTTRLNALSPFQNQTLCHVLIGHMEKGGISTIWIVVRPGDLNIVLVENGGSRKKEDDQHSILWGDLSLHKSQRLARGDSVE
jgi:hypothetical protein